ncbi:B-cell lymphoma 3 protein homolog [Oreochromis niloticus]|uniref:BCL3 transcription coactivator n=1 Tax=Oreochromis niloticus TaxID=8128 RepID=A0A669B2M6_ORENI|nr:B-cell lymphoma 3 protein [Oreochromis niloticus]XP_005463984.1 B-cell lymphoma 3 protein [Oreochromis niloticus]XP_013121960.1 B-cell lymphoma 3 protein [Oreochromis niloticus]
MPRIMTMNGTHKSVAPVPLDLRTNIRARGNAGGTPACGSRDARVTGGSPAPPAFTGADSLDENCPTVRGVSVSPTSASRKRPADRSASQLPFRKRPIPVEPETKRLSPSKAEKEDRFSPPEDKTLADPVERVGIAPVTPRQLEGQIPNGYPICFFPYGHYPVFCLPHLSEPNNVVAHQTENVLAGIAQATRQDEDGDTALHIAVVQGELAMVYKLIQFLVLAHKDVDIYNNLRQTPLHLAVITKQANMVEALLKAGADPAALDRNGQTALHLCCEYDQRDCLSVLLSMPSSATCLEIRNFEGFSPLHLAVLQGRKDLARMLLDAGADINAMDIKSGQSPLMHAVESNNADMVHFLIENRCDVNSQSYSGNTALHSACGRGQVETVRLLLKSGADSSLKNYHNDTPVMVAKNKKIADVLRGRGSRQIRVQDQHCMSVSPVESNLTENGSPSPSHSRGCSPSTTPHIVHQSASHSPETSILRSQTYCPVRLASMSTQSSIKETIRRHHAGEGFTQWDGGAGMDCT